MCAAARIGRLEGEKTNGNELKSKTSCKPSSASAGANCGEVTLTHVPVGQIGVEIKTIFNLTSDSNLTSVLPVNHIKRDALSPMA